MKAKKIIVVVVLIGLLILVFAVVARGKIKMSLEEKFIEYFIRKKNPNISSDIAHQIAMSTVKWAKERNLNLWSILAIAYQESWFDPNATEKQDSTIISKGIMQLSKPALNELINQKYISSYDWNKLFDADYNIMLGTLYYLFCVRLANGNRREAFARYNRTTDFTHPTAQSYADGVLQKRAEIVSEWEKFEK